LGLRVLVRVRMRVTLLETMLRLQEKIKSPQVMQRVEKQLGSLGGGKRLRKSLLHRHWAYGNLLESRE
jgi:hypothetical protein